MLEGKVKIRAIDSRIVDLSPVQIEKEYSADEWEFVQAMDLYKRNSGIKFPSWSEALAVLKALGYRKDAKKAL